MNPTLEAFQNASGDARDRLQLILRDAERVIRRGYPRVNLEGAQGGEDAKLAALLPEGNAGFSYVDVGAAEPRECSNTWSLYQRGWRGLLVEPLPQFWYPLLRHRPGDVLEPVAVLDRPGLAYLRVAGTVSSFRTDWPINEQAQLMVEVETLASIMARHPGIRDTCALLSIDVEGSELEVLRGNDWSTFRPGVIVVEAMRYDPDKVGEDVSATWEPVLLENGYQHAGSTQLNRIYTRRDR